MEFKIYELDGISSNDLLATCQVTVRTRNDSDATLTQDIVDFDRIYPGGDTSLTYEILAVVTHNCTSDGKFRCLKSKPQSISVRGNQQFNDFFYFFHNEGYEGTCT